MFECPLRDCISNENNTHVVHTLSKCFTMHLNDSSSMAQHFKSHSVSQNPNFGKP